MSTHRLAASSLARAAVCTVLLALTACGERAVQAPAPASTSAPSASAASLAAAASVAESPVAAYLTGAEIQAETDAQRRELRRALADLIDQPAETLRTARYAGPQGEPAQRDLVQLLRAHVVPASPHALDLDTLLADKDRPEARAALRGKLEEIDRSLSASKP
jgi:hypothetical protein